MSRSTTIVVVVILAVVGAGVGGMSACVDSHGCPAEFLPNVFGEAEGCVQDSECGAGQVCNECSVCVTPCADDDKSLPPASFGRDRVLDAPSLRPSETGTCPAGQTRFELAWEMLGANDIAAHLNARNFIRFATSSAEPVWSSPSCNASDPACTFAPSGNAATCTCALCLTGAPPDLAMEIVTKTENTNAACVSISGPPAPEPPPVSGEGEDPPPAPTCGGLDVSLGSVGAVTLTDANLTSNGTTCDCTTAGGSCFDLDVTLDASAVASSDIDNANWIHFAADATGDGAVYAATSCNGSAVQCADDGNGGLICVCGLCLSAGAPTNLAVQVHTAKGDTNGLCVNIQ